MQVATGFSDIPASNQAGVLAARQAMEQAHRQDPCDLALLFCTARHDQHTLRQGVASVVGEGVPIYGGGAVGIITNEAFGYAGDQVGVACLWLDGSRCDVLMEPGLLEDERATGERLGQKLAANGAGPDTPVVLFYDAVDGAQEQVRLLMATWILEGMKQGLGFLPNLVGAGLQGDHVCSPAAQYTGDGLGRQLAMALSFSNDIRIDTAIMHGCRPASQYYTVTKADGPVILEINGRPALDFMDGLLGPAVTPQQYPFFLLFGINHGDKWGAYNENNYASRLCLGIDEKRRGIVMFEPDMVAGTRFQLMFRSLDLDYMRPKLEALFENLDGRTPVFGMYIDCAGRCAGYGGLDLEDALVVQQAVDGRVPLLGLYTGVEIASMGGEPRGLDWTGVFCLFSQAGPGGGDAGTPRAHTRAWQPPAPDGDYEPPLDAALALAEQNAAKVLQLDTQLIATRHELEQKRRGFALLAELVVLLRQTEDYDQLFHAMVRRINAALNMQRTAMLLPTSGGAFTPVVLQGYTEQEKAALAGLELRQDPSLADPLSPVLVTGADDTEYFADVRAMFGLPYFIASPIVVNREVAAVLITGRLAEQPPFLSRLGPGDVETVGAIGALMGSILLRQQLDEAEERTRLMLDATPLCANFWDEHFNNIDCNLEAVKLFGLQDKQQYLDRFDELSPETQPDGRRSAEAAAEHIATAFREGRCVFEWMHQKPDGEPIPSEVTLVRVRYKKADVVIGYTRDLRELKARMAEIERTQEALREARDRAEDSSRAKSNFLANMSHEIRTPMNAIIGMTKIARSSDDPERIQYCLGKTEDASNHLLGIINDILDMSKIDAGKFTLSPSDFTVERMLERVTSVINFKVDEKQLQFIIKVDRDVPDAIVADRQRLAQVITNLLSNAVKFTPEGGKVSLLVHLEKEIDGLCTLHFEVADTGIGIAADQQARLFDSFEQADGSISRRFGGTGLGLAISKDIVAMMGGRIWVESEPGKGSNFQFTVQARRGKAQQAGKLNPAVDWRKIRILVVDDANEVLEYFQDVAQAAGLNCDVAHDGLEACRMMERGDGYHVIFVDWKMPGMDGIELTRQIRQTQDDQAVVVMISAANWSQVEGEARAAGVDRFIAKPLLPSPIIDCINECVGAGLDYPGTGHRAVGEGAGAFVGRRILLAEDIEINREIVSVLLEDTGVEIDSAENGRRAVELFGQHPDAYDAILMDIHMPEMDGYQATRAIRAMPQPKARTIPIIAMTANVFKEDIENCLAAGMNDHVGKPLDIDELIAKLRRFI